MDDEDNNYREREIDSIAIGVKFFKLIIAFLG